MKDPLKNAIVIEHQTWKSSCNWLVKRQEKGGVVAFKWCDSLETAKEHASELSKQTRLPVRIAV